MAMNDASSLISSYFCEIMIANDQNTNVMTLILFKAVEDLANVVVETVADFEGVVLVDGETQTSYLSKSTAVMPQICAVLHSSSHCSPPALTELYK